MENFEFKFPLDELADRISEKLGIKIESLRNDFAKADDSLLTGKQACDTLHISKPTLNRWRKAGAIPFKRVGRQIRYLKSDLLSAEKNLKKYKSKKK